MLAIEGEAYDSDLWVDLIHTEGAEVLATYKDSFYTGIPAATRHEYGDGIAYYLGTRSEGAYTARLLFQACQEAKVNPPLEAPFGVETVRRRIEGSSFLLILNHNKDEVEMILDTNARDLLTGDSHHTHLSLEPGNVSVLEETAIQNDYDQYSPEQKQQ